MLKRIKDFLWEEKMATISVDHLPSYLKKYYGKKEELSCEDFIKFLNLEHRNMTDKANKLFVWFDTFDKRKKESFLRNNEEFYKNNAFVMSFAFDLRESKQAWLRELMFIQHMEKQNYPYKHYDFNEEFADLLKSEQVTEHIKKNGDKYTQFLIKRRSTATVKWYYENSYYSVFAHILEKSEVKIDKPEFVKGFAESYFQVREQEGSLKEMFYQIGKDNTPEDIAAIRKILEDRPVLYVLYENAILKEMITQDEIITPHLRKRL